MGKKVLDPTTVVVQQAARYVKKWQRALSLNSWRITITSAPKATLNEITGMDSLAMVTARLPLLQATMTLAGDWPWVEGGSNPDYDLEVVVVHELAHIRLTAVEDALWEYLQTLTDYLPPVLADQMDRPYQSIREAMVNTVVGVAMEGEREWKR